MEDMMEASEMGMTLLSRRPCVAGRPGGEAGQEGGQAVKGVRVRRQATADKTFDATRLISCAGPLEQSPLPEDTYMNFNISFHMKYCNRSSDT